jgi:hypothetical protein
VERDRRGASPVSPSRVDRWAIPPSAGNLDLFNYDMGDVSLFLYINMSVV